MEPILKDNPNRFVIFPIQHDDIWEFTRCNNQQSGQQKNLTYQRT